MKYIYRYLRKNGKRIPPFTVISHKLILNDELSLEEKGLMLILLSNRDDFNQEKSLLPDKANSTMTPIDRILKQLRKKGYVSRKRSRDLNGNWVFETLVFEDSSLNPGNLDCGFDDAYGLDGDSSSEPHAPEPLSGKAPNNTSIYYNQEMKSVVPEYKDHSDTSNISMTNNPEPPGLNGAVQTSVEFPDQEVTLEGDKTYLDSAGIEEYERKRREQAMSLQNPVAPKSISGREEPQDKD